MQAMEAHSDSARSSAIHSARKFEDLVHGNFEKSTKLAGYSAVKAHSDSARSSAIHSAQKFEDLVQEDMMICC